MAGQWPGSERRVFGVKPDDFVARIRHLWPGTHAFGAAKHGPASLREDFALRGLGGVSP
jgi:hypothetical protein